MSLRKNGQALHFPCECVSVQHGYSDPWAGVTQNKLLNDGTKERVLNSVARQPKTIARLAKELGLSQPTVHTHINDMLKSELLREA
ncbi:MAG: winged helix-turn-helix transcriptional regulator, partial [Betaproteobacteria bacterium]